MFGRFWPSEVLGVGAAAARLEFGGRLGPARAGSGLHDAHEDVAAVREERAETGGLWVP